jgi:RNA polymerase sigma-70 factor (ECF subfamily)
MDLDDPDRVVRAQAGDEDALRDLFAEVRPVVLSYCRRRVGTYPAGRQLAEDVTQDVCLALVTALPRYVYDGAPFSAYVFAIASHKVNDVHRRRSREPFLGLWEEDLELLPLEPSPERQVVARAELDVVLRLIALLPPKMAMALRLRAAGLGAVEIAAVMGMTPGAVRVTEHRAARRLRDMLADSQGPC